MSEPSDKRPPKAKPETPSQKPPLKPSTNQSDLDPINWKGMKPHYEAGLISKNQLAKRFGCSRKAIDKHAEKYGWERAELNDHVKQRAQELVATSSQKQVVTPEGAALQVSAQVDLATVEINAQALAIVLLNQRTSIERSRRIVDKLMTELELVLDHPELAHMVYDALHPLDRENAATPAMLEDLARLISSLPERARTFKVLAEGQQRVVDMERVSWGLNKTEGDGEEPTAIIKDYTGVGDVDSPGYDTDRDEDA